MKTHPIRHGSIPLPLEHQIERATCRLANVSFAGGFAVGALAASGFWCWLTWGAS